MSKVLIVGGVAGGATAAARLRRLDEKAEIIMFERGEYISFANCGLPYYIGGVIQDQSSLTVQTPESFNKRLNIDVRNLQEVLSIDKAKKTVEVKNHKTGEIYIETYDKLILSPGASPVRPNIEGMEDPRVFTLRNIPDTVKIKRYIDEKKPEKAVVVGGGFIGVEVAENLHEAGVDVTIVEFSDHLLPPLDFDMAVGVHNHLKQNGVNVILGDGVKAIKENGSRLSVELSKDNLVADMVIMSVGVRPESKLARDAGLNTNPKGAIVVDEYLKTSDENIYAIGDAIEITELVTGEKGYIPLAGPANKMGRIAADNVFGINKKYNGTQGTGILKCFDLTVANTGINEARAKALGLDYEKSVITSPSHATYYPGATSMTLKIIFDSKDGRLLGAQVVGFDGVDKRIDVFATAIRAKMTVFDLTELELAYAPPFSSAKDPVNMIGFVAENIMTDRYKTYDWNEVENVKKEDATLLDVRTNIEFSNNGIEGYHNIPVDELRENIEKIDKSKTVYIACQQGVKGYIAARILSAHGYKCYNLSGGCIHYYNIYPRTEQYKRAEGKNNPPKDSGKNDHKIEINACGMQCPGPIMKLSEAVKEAKDGEIIEIKTTDMAFAADVEAWCKQTGNTFLENNSGKGIATSVIMKGKDQEPENSKKKDEEKNKKNIIVFSGDLDKAIASFIIANTAAAMGREVSMFFTFWGLNILRKPERVKVNKDAISKMFGRMMPRGSKKLKLSKMNMGGMGTKMMRKVMNDKNVDSLESLIKASIENGVKLVACSMTLDVMGIHQDELIEGVSIGGAATMMAHGEESDMSLFI